MQAKLQETPQSMEALFGGGPRSVWLVEEAVSRGDVVTVLAPQIDSKICPSRKHEHYLLQLQIEFPFDMVDWRSS